MVNKRRAAGADELVDDGGAEMAFAGADVAHEEEPGADPAMAVEVVGEILRDGQDIKLLFLVLPEGDEIGEGLVEKPLPEHAVGDQGVQPVPGCLFGPLLQFLDHPFALTGPAGKLRPVGFFAGDLQV